MRVLILHDAVAADPRPDEIDVVVQVRAVEDALRTIGHVPQRLAFSSDQIANARALRAAGADVAFNLVESVDRQGRLAYLATELLEQAGMPFTGNGAAPTRATASKLDAKRALRAGALPTPNWFALPDLRGRATVPEVRYLLKSVWEHGSLGLDADSVIETGDARALRDKLLAHTPRLGGEGFAEEFVDGREFNLALLEGPAGLECLPPAEIRFTAGAGALRIVGYAAKWDCGSAADLGTPRAFDFSSSDVRLLDELRSLALATCRRFDARGYIRVDFRVDAAGVPWIVDVNTNPCLSPGAGFEGTAAHAGITMTDIVRRLLSHALVRAQSARHRLLAPRAADGC